MFQVTKADGESGIVDDASPYFSYAASDYYVFACLLHVLCVGLCFLAHGTRKDQ